MSKKIFTMLSLALMLSLIPKFSFTGDAATTCSTKQECNDIISEAQSQISDLKSNQSELGDINKELIDAQREISDVSKKLNPFSMYKSTICVNNSWFTDVGSLSSVVGSLIHPKPNLDL